MHGLNVFADAENVSDDSNHLAGAWHRKGADWQLSQHLKDNELLESALVTHLTLFLNASLTRSTSFSGDQSLETLRPCHHQTRPSVRSGPHCYHARRFWRAIGYQSSSQRACHRQVPLL